MKRCFIIRALSLLILFCSSLSVLAQTGKTVSGTVKDAAGIGIIGAGVVVQGTNNGTITAADGSFTLPKVSGGASLEISCIGYKSKTVAAVNGMTVVLEEGNEALDEVIFVAYGTTKKASFSGSASVVKNEQLEKSNGVGFSEALQGMSAGVQVSNFAANPGAEARIQIR